MAKEFPVFRIDNFEDYNHCAHCGNGFYIRNFNEHLKDNLFLDKPHGHDFFIILLITQGTGIHAIDFRSYEVRPGAAFFISPGQVHQWQLSDDVDGYIIFFTREYMLLEYHNSQLARLPYFNTRTSEPVLFLNGERSEHVCSIFKRIEHEYVRKERFFHEVIRLELKILILEIERQHDAENNLYCKNHKETQYERFEMLVEKHFKEHRSVNEYCEMMNLSLRQLGALCKKVTGKTPGDIIQERMILEAKRMLVHSDQPVFLVSEALNYHDCSYFIRLFRKVTGCTPEQFRGQVSINSVA